MQNITGTLMSEDRVIATMENGVITDADETLLPLYLKRTRNIESWLASRAIDSNKQIQDCLKEFCVCAPKMMCKPHSPLTRQL